MKEALKTLLNRLDAIEKVRPEIGDTDVREQMSEVVYHGLIAQKAGYEVPHEVGMFEPAGNDAVREALVAFLTEARATAPATPEERFAAFQDAEVLSDAGHPYDEYFGHGEYGMVSAAFTRAESPELVPPPAKAWWQFWK